MPILKWALTPILCYITAPIISSSSPTQERHPHQAGVDDTHLAVVDLLPLVPEGSHVKTQTLKTLEFIQAAKLVPRLLGEPGAGIGVRVVQAHASRQKKAPIALIHLWH